MRKILFAVTLAVFAAWLAAGPSAAAEPPREVSVLNITGQVDVRMGPTGTWVPATKETRLGAGDEIRTRADSHADLDFGGKAQAAVVRVDPKSTMKIETYVDSQKAEERKILLDLMVGEVLVKVNKVRNESQFRVRTPTSIVGVRGTMFRVKTSISD